MNTEIRVDKHSQAQSGFDLQIEVAELELIHPPGSETLLHRTVHSFQSAVGDEKKRYSPSRFSRAMHTAEQESFSPLQGVACWGEIEFL